MDHALIGEATNIPINESVPVISISPVVVPAPGRIVDLQIRVSAPITGNNLPIILLSHGQGRSNHLSSLNGYSPLTNFWAAHGFVVVQPTHLSSKSLNLKEPPGQALFWRSRAEDMKHIIDQLDHIESSLPNIKGRLDKTRIAVAGHSMGGHTASLLIGQTLVDPEEGTVVTMTEPRIKAGVLLTPPGNGGADLSAFAFEHYTFFRQPNFAEMKTPALVVVGENDNLQHLTVRGAHWHADPYSLSPGPKSLLTLFGATHGLGGISGYDVAETTDENPERVSVVQRLTWAYLRSELYPEDPAWSNACAALEKLKGVGRVESK
ncbi:platelet-activating factor acetylhydrolase plasma [Coleophoma crateriformis]|uniref:Platelet-activating factor acetylhydrolase plasma n=1 Tax=Coleophoma crateriformis TaxID=565419 RepID=A0A3D8SM59_9HELO|nr:platelet-activating factor acetylhydrolase plasma [Coleophoma crateriformis]